MKIKITLDIDIEITEKKQIGRSTTEMAVLNAINEKLGTKQENMYVDEVTVVELAIL